MQKPLRIIVISLIISLTLFSCVKTNKQTSCIRSENPERIHERGPEMRRPPEAELSLMRLKKLIEETQIAPSLELTPEQVSKILPILEQWKTVISSNEPDEAYSFAEKLSAVLTDTQNSYLPDPPPAGGPEGQGPSPAHDRLSISSILDELIPSLSELQEKEI